MKKDTELKAMVFISILMLLIGITLAITEESIATGFYLIGYTLGTLLTLKVTNSIY